jgi:two-component system, sensor histidine kinase and response regulator
VIGTVTCNQFDGAVCVQNGDDGLKVQTGVKQDLRVGELIEVIGFPGFDAYSPILEDVSIRRLEASNHIEPLTISAADAQSGSYDGRLVAMTGTIMLQDTHLGRKDRPVGLRFALQEGTQVFQATLHDPPPDLASRIRTGSRIRVTGVCRVSGRPLAGSGGNQFSVQMRNSADLEVIEAASWWNLEHAMQVVTGLALAVALGLCWLTLLRRKVQRQTSIIRSQLQLETALSERFRDLFENSTDLVFTVDIHGQFTAMNRAAKQTFGCTGLDTSTVSLRSFVRSEDVPVLTDILGLLIGGEPSVLRQLSINPWDRRQTIILEMNCLIRHGNGGPISIDIIARDVTEQKREQIAREEARVAAEAASRAKSEFLANMSHEIRTPMSGILGMTELTLATPLADDQRTNLEIVKTSADALLTIINDILDLSKIEAGRMDLEHTQFNLCRVIESTLDLVSLPASQKGIELVSDIDPTLPAEWIGDAARLRQVLMNLVGNAVKFTEAGEIVLRIDHIRLDDGTCRAHFRVEDSGIGIPLEQHKRIFEMFCQADGSTSRKYGGTGLGLAIASRLVSLMGGRLLLESTPGKGSTFSFTIDIRSRGDAPIIPPGCLQGRMARLSEPNATSRAAIARILNHAGVTVVEDGSASIVIATEDPSDLDVPLVLLLAGGRSVPEPRRASAIVRKPVALCALVKAVEGTTRLQSVLALDAVSRGSAEFVRAGKSAALQSAAGQRTVLLAEDNKVNQMLAVRTLEKGGYKVLVANNGAEAVQAAKNADIDLILMDIQMPEMDGFQATARIHDSRKASGLAALPVIAMTAHALKGDRERCINAGMTDYISKPVRPADLVDIVSRYALRSAT